MLTSLRIKNLALVQDLRIPFQSGLNVITGETGAGKSILMGALKLLLGERADKSAIRSGEDACLVDAVFEFPSTTSFDALLAENGVDMCEGMQLVIRRIIKASGTSQNMVNDCPVTLQLLKRLGALLVDMYGVYDHQSLLHTDTQLDILDAFGCIDKERKAYEKKYRDFWALEKRKQELLQNHEDVEAQIDLLSYRVKEIEDAALAENEEEKIRQEHTIMGHAQRILELSNTALTMLTENEDSVFNTLTHTQRMLDELSRLVPDAEDWKQELHGLTVQELGTTIQSFVSGIESDPARLHWLDERLALYQKMKRKHGNTVSEIFETLEASKKRLKDLKTRSEQLADIEKNMEHIYSQLEQTGNILRDKRQQVSGGLSKNITKELKELGFSHRAFRIRLSATTPQTSGMDEIEFEFAPNAGESHYPLRAIASSGEISRVMLATKAVLAKHDKIPLLVFDEVDAHIGGEMGTAVGCKLSEISTYHQVIVITHLPQVAVFGNTHFAVSKDVKGNRTFTNIETIEKEGRVEEIARMLGGKKMTDVTLQHAREMLKQA
ncbi:MAG: DNA repair protein RecN [Kiritimatiellae bacterium]|nr:DNA repair protein RecN [Kiritimatiellia bacterium]